jgi:hypothetical protein
MIIDSIPIVLKSYNLNLNGKYEPYEINKVKIHHVINPDVYNEIRKDYNLDADTYVLHLKFYLSTPN